jgi:tellurite resistance protein TehA-like permease
VSGEMNLGKGNKRRVRQIRWKRSEIVSVILFTLAITILCVYLALWLARHPFD